MATLFGESYNFYYAPDNAGKLLAEGILYEMEKYNETSQKWFEKEYRPWFFRIEQYLEPVLKRGISEAKEDARFFLVLGRRLMSLSSEEAAQKIAKWNDCQDLVAILSEDFCRGPPNVAYAKLPETGTTPIPCCNGPKLGCRYAGQSLDGNGTRVCDKALQLERKKVSDNHARQKSLAQTADQNP